MRLSLFGKWRTSFFPQRSRQRSHSLFWTAACLFAAALIAVPALTVFTLIFLPGHAAQPNLFGRLWQTVLPGYIINTLQLVGGVGIGTLLIGVTTAWLVTAFDFPGRRWFNWALMMPMAMPAYLIAFVYIELLDFAGPVQTTLRVVFHWQSAADYYFPPIASLGGAILLLSLVLYPYVFLMARTAFGEQSGRLLEAGRTLNLTTRQSFFRLVLPLARPAIIAGLMLVEMETIGDFGLVQLFSVQTFTVGIYNTWFGANNLQGAATLSAGLLAMVIVLITIERYSRRRKRYTQGKAHPLRPLRLHGLKAVGAFCGCFLPVLLGFILPVLLQSWWFVSAIETIRLSTFWHDAANSLLLALLTALCSLGLAILLAYGQRIAPGKIVSTLVRVASSGYALPGPVVALGVLLPLAWLDRGLIAFAATRFDYELGYLFSGSLLILVYAYLVRFMALSFGSVESGLERIGGNLDDAARTLKAGATAILRRVHLPLLKGSMMTALLLVTVDVMKELPATLMLQPFNFSTLATRAFSYAEEEMYSQASLWSISIVLAGVIPVIFLNKRALSSLENHPTTKDGRQ